MSSLQKSDRSRLRRAPYKARYDEETVFDILDAGLIAHVGYVDKGEPLVTPTAYWRVDDCLYWHGSTAGRFIKATDKKPVCVTVTHFDGLIFARSGFHHSALFRTVMAFGTCTLIKDATAVKEATDEFLDRLIPGRAETVRPVKKQELKATTLVRFQIEEASAKVRTSGVIDDEDDYEHPVWAGVVKCRTIVDGVVDDKRLVDGIERPENLDSLRCGTSFETYVKQGNSAR